MCVLKASEREREISKDSFSDVITGMTFMKRSENYEHKKKIHHRQLFLPLSPLCCRLALKKAHHGAEGDDECKLKLIKISEQKY